MVTEKDFTQHKADFDRMLLIRARRQAVILAIFAIVTILSTMYAFFEDTTIKKQRAENDLLINELAECRAK